MPFMLSQKCSRNDLYNTENIDKCSTAALKIQKYSFKRINEHITVLYME